MNMVPHPPAKPPPAHLLVPPIPSHTGYDSFEDMISHFGTTIEGQASSSPSQQPPPPPPPPSQEPPPPPPPPPTFPPPPPSQEPPPTFTPPPLPPFVPSISWKEREKKRAAASKRMPKPPGIRRVAPKMPLPLRVDRLVMQLSTMGGAGDAASGAGGTEGAEGSEGAGGGVVAGDRAARSSAGAVGGVVVAKSTPARGTGGTRRTPSDAEGIAEPHAEEALVGSART